jgi:hypothetical protein
MDVGASSRRQFYSSPGTTSEIVKSQELSVSTRPAAGTATLEPPSVALSQSRPAANVV